MEPAVTRYVQVDRRDLVYLKFILEAYEGLATMSTEDRQRGIVSIHCGAWADGDVGELLTALGREISLIELEGTGA